MSSQSTLIPFKNVMVKRKGLRRFGMGRCAGVVTYADQSRSMIRNYIKYHESNEDPGVLVATRLGSVHRQQTLEGEILITCQVQWLQTICGTMKKQTKLST